MDRTRERLRERLVGEGQAILDTRPKPMPFTGEPEADALLNDLAGHPHAFVFGCLVDIQMPAERAWRVPLLVRQRVGSFEFVDLAELSEAGWMRVMREPFPAHRFSEKMATVLYRATRRIAALYAGDAAKIWEGCPSSAVVVRRFREFHGAGPKVATHAANVLVRRFHVHFSDYRSIDVSADVHVQRVMARLGFVEEGSGRDVVVDAARKLNPAFPGIFDLALWDIGRMVCRPQRPQCPDCRLKDLCAYARTHGEGE